MISTLLEKIGITHTDDNYCVFTETAWKTRIPYRLHKGLEKINPHSFLLQNDRIIALFFEIPSLDTKTKKEIFTKIWNLGSAPIIFIITEDTVNIYNGFSFHPDKSSFDLLKLGSKKITEENLKENLSIWDLLSGKAFEHLKENKSQVDVTLLENLTRTKEVLVKNGLESKYAQNLIGRLLFSRYLLDRGVKVLPKFFNDKASFLDLIRNKKLLYEYFNYLKKTFNGDLFPVCHEEQSSITTEHLNILSELFAGSEISDTAIQPTLFDMYDFSIIPIELISEVYERFIGIKDKKKKGAYYTPTFLVDYILEKTIKPHLEVNSECKVFDPSCGSGIFLVETLRTIIENNLDTEKKITKTALKKLLVKNIFGIDIDETAINLTVFSLCLTLLEYIKPKDVTKFKFPNLLEKNLFQADFFDTTHLFNNKIKKIDFILGNPPWGSDKAKGNYHIKYFTDEKIPVSDKQLAQSFIARTSDFANNDTKCVFVLPSKPILYNHNAANFRKYFLSNFSIDEVLELSPVRHQVFSKAVAPSAIIFFRKLNPENSYENTVIHTSVKPNIFLDRLNLIVIEKSDIKHIKQQYFIDYDYMWKIMLYGNVFDFYMIKRLKKDFNSLEDMIDENGMTIGQGLQVGGGDHNDGSFLLGKKYINTQNKALSKFFINESVCKKWDIKYLHRPRSEKLYKPPYVLLKRAFDKKTFSMQTVYTENEYIFSNLINAIQGNNHLLLKSLCGNYNSVLYRYFILLQSTSAGLERDEVMIEDLLNYPMVFNDSISSKVDKIQKLYKDFNSKLIHRHQLEEEIKTKENELNKIILNSFNLSEQETLLIDYAVQVTIPQINKSLKPLKSTPKEQLKKYAQIFIDHFSERWNGSENYFSAEIYYDDYVTGINFNVLDAEPQEQIKCYPNKKTEEIFCLLKLGEEKISNLFFKQRDIRGFNETSFYVVKPNQCKNWHPAVAYGDLTEFIDAMLKAERGNS